MIDGNSPKKGKGERISQYNGNREKGKFQSNKDMPFLIDQNLLAGYTRKKKDGNKHDQHETKKEDIRLFLQKE